MRIKKRSLRIFFATTILILMSFACDWGVPNPILSSVTCTKSGSESAVCTYVCKKGGGSLSDNRTQSFGSGGFVNVEKEEELEKLCAETYPNDYSQPVSAASEATEPPTEEAPTDAPTEAPTEAPPAELPVPILTGEVTYCDLVSRSVNLRLVEGFSAEEFNHQVTIGGEAMSCKFNEGNASLLTCTFPATIKFPVSIQASQDGNIVNEFDYNGSNCIYPTGTKVKGQEPPQESPADDVVCDPVVLAMDHVCVPMP